MGSDKIEALGLRVDAATKAEAEWVEERMKEYDRQFLPEENIRSIDYIVKNDHDKSI